MSAPDRIGNWITAHSAVVIVTLLLTTALLGSGVAMIDDDSSLEQFETDSPEVEASEYAAENFSTAGDGNTTTVQLIVRGENVLTKESLLDSLAFQQELRDADAIDATLAENDSAVGVENLLVISAMVDERIDELEAEADAINASADELEAEFEALNESADDLEAELEALNESADELEAESEALNASADELEAELEALNASADELEADAETLEWQAERLADRAAQLEADFERLERDGEELAQEQAALEARAEMLSGALADTSEVQAEYEARNLTESEADAKIEALLQGAIDEAALDADQERQFRASAEEVRTLTSERAQLEATLEQAFEDGTVGVVGPDPRADDLLAALNQVAELQSQYDQLNASYAAGEIDDGAYAENATELETAIETTLQEAADEAALEQDERDDFLAAAADVRSLTSDLFEVETALARVVEGAPFELFQDEFAELEARGEELETRGAELEAEAESIEARGERLADRGDELEVRGDELEAWGEELEARGDELEAWGEELEARGDELEAWGEELEARGDELEAWGEELEAWADDLEARGDELEAAFEELEAFDPSLDEQLEYLESMSAAAFEEAVSDTLGDDDNDFALGLLPSSYDPGSTSADARMTFITQSTAEATSAGEPGGFGADVVDAQLEMRELASDRNQEYVVFGAGAMMDEIDRSMGDSLAIVGPLALLFVVIALSVAYRDPLDIVLGVLGILTVLVWTFGFMGWTGIAFNQMMIAVPVLLIGLSIDYAIHVFMRHREQREADGVTDDVRGSMTVALAGVGVALVWVTATTAIGFLANLVSPIEPIRAFGIVSAFGILAALVVFGALVPAVKVELDCLLERAGFDRRKRAFGTGESRFASALSVGAIAARRAPLVVLLAVLLLTAGGMYGATQVDTSFEDEDFLADSPPDWVYSLPAPFTPGEYHAKAELDYVNENFQREDAQAQLLIRGEVTDDETLERVAAIEERAGESDVVYVLASGAADVDSPLSTMEDVAANNESFNESFVAADTTGDGVPNENLEALYDELFEVDENAANLIYRTDDGEYEAIRMLVSISGNAGSAETTDEMRDLAASFDDGGTDPRWSAIATGGPIVNHVVEQDLLNTVLESLAITLVVVFVFLTVAYWMTGNSATLGAVTLLPVAFTVSWILGTMYLLGMPFNVLTGMITSLTIGLGVAYSVHVSSRYTLELERQGNVWDAMHTTVTGTGGALLGSAATTVGGFGTLALAILPALQQFGIITGLTIVYAFLASVIVLPTLLVLWTRYFGPDVSFDVSSRTPATPTASDGGQDVSSGGDE